jgi:hypothetical protein
MSEGKRQSKTKDHTPGEKLSGSPGERTPGDGIDGDQENQWDISPGRDFAAPAPPNSPARAPILASIPEGDDTGSGEDESDPSGHSGLHSHRSHVCDSSPTRHASHTSHVNHGVGPGAYGASVGVSCGARATSATSTDTRGTSATSPGARVPSATSPGARATSATCPGARATSATSPGACATSATSSDTCTPSDFAVSPGSRTSALGHSSSGGSKGRNIKRSGSASPSYRPSSPPGQHRGAVKPKPSTQSIPGRQGGARSGEGELSVEGQPAVLHKKTQQPDLLRQHGQQGVSVGVHQGWQQHGLQQQDEHQHQSQSQLPSMNHMDLLMQESRRITRERMGADPQLGQLDLNLADEFDNGGDDSSSTSTLTSARSVISNPGSTPTASRPNSRTPPPDDAPVDDANALGPLPDPPVDEDNAQTSPRDPPGSPRG